MLESSDLLIIPGCTIVTSLDSDLPVSSTIFDETLRSISSCDRTVVSSGMCDKIALDEVFVSDRDTLLIGTPASGSISEDS